MLDKIAMIKMCVDAVRACDKGGAWSEEDKPTFNKMLDNAIEDATKEAEKLLRQLNKK